MRVKAESEITRITVSVALIATFLTVVFNIEKLIPQSPSSLVLTLKSILYVHLIVISVVLTFYLLYLARNLKYQKERSDLRASDLSFFLQYCFLRLFDRKKLSLEGAELNDWVDDNARRKYASFYDQGIAMAFFFPITVISVLTSIYVCPAVQNAWGWSHWITALAVFVLIMVMIVLLRFFRFRATGV